MVSKKFAEQVSKNNPSLKSGIFSSHPPQPEFTKEATKEEKTELVKHFNTKFLPVSHFKKPRKSRQSLECFNGIGVDFLTK